jgi:hypothetical protein
MIQDVITKTKQFRLNTLLQNHTKHTGRGRQCGKVRDFFTLEQVSFEFMTGFKPSNDVTFCITAAAKNRVF